MQKDEDELLKVYNATEPSNKPNYNGFIRLVSSKAITSIYGPCIHPTTGKNSFHTGVDFSEPKGTPIKASKVGSMGL
ncbi:MAG: M23 family metallopeptidase [Sarcina sp.]